MEERRWNERGLGEARAERIEARVAVVRSEAGRERREELVRRRGRADGGRWRSTGTESKERGGEDEKFGADADRHAGNLDAGRLVWKGIRGGTPRDGRRARAPRSPNRTDTGPFRSCDGIAAE